jgi:glycosyltransferase involved in cell wall biosynthesis
MNILVWNSWITPAGGMERVALSLANGFAERGANVTLVGPYESVPVLRQAIGARVDFRQCDFSRSLGGLIRNARYLRRVTREKNIDVVSAHGSLFPLLGLDKPVVWTEHGPRYGSRNILSGPKALPWLAIRNRLRSGEWKLVGCSEYVCRRVGTQLDIPVGNSIVIYNGVPKAEALSGLAPPAWGKPAKIGLLGRLEPEKYPTDIFAIDAELQRMGVDCEWLVFGEGSLSGEMRSRAAGHPRIRIRGLAPSGAAALAEVDALAFLSHGDMEGLPTVMLEARLARRPVIAWDVTANPEAAGPLDKLVEPFDLGAFSRAIAETVRGRVVPLPAGDTISYDRMIDQYLEVLGSTGGRPAALESRSMIGADS